MAVVCWVKGRGVGVGLGGDGGGLVAVGSERKRWGVYIRLS